MASGDRSIADIDCKITSLMNLRSLYPRTHPQSISCIFKLANERMARYHLSRDKQDRDKYIVLCAEAILLPPDSWAKYSSIMIAQVLFRIAIALKDRFEEFEHPEDIKSSIEYLHYLRGLACDTFDVPRNDVTNSLINALGSQAEKSEAGDRIQNIKEMLVLYRELITSNLSANFPVAALRSLSKAISTGFYEAHVNAQLVDQVVECVRDATKMCPPDSHEVCLVLAETLRTRFATAHSVDDYEDTMALLDRILDPNQLGECPGELRDRASVLAVDMAIGRSAIFQNPEYIEVTISRLRNYLSSPSINERARLVFTGVLARETTRRFVYYSLAESLEEANSSTSQLVVDLSSSGSQEEFGGFGDLIQTLASASKSYPVTSMDENIQHLEGLLSTTPPGTPRHIECLCRLGAWYESKFRHSKNLSDIEESIKYSRLSLDATPSGSLRRIRPLSSLRDALKLAFEKTREISYLDESIIIGYDLFELARRSSQQSLFLSVATLVQLLLVRGEFLGRGPGEDRHEIVRLIPKVIDDPYASEPDRFQLSCQWAAAARSVNHPTTLTAYRRAMSLMQKSLSFAPTVSIQHARLVKMAENCQNMPIDYASYQIRLGRFEEAVETLEQGRAVLWSEMRGLHAPVAGLVEDSPWAERIAEINQELGAMTISVTPSGRPEMEYGVAQDRDLTDPFGRLVVKQRKLLEERDTLVSQIQGKPELPGILSAPSFATLRSAAARGPVILINHSGWRSDILIISHNSLPCSIPTVVGFYARANELRDELASARKHGLDSSEYQDALCSVLKGLYDLVGEPVIKRLRMLGVPEQSRIWWCPTSVFCSLPLHAMGPVPSRNTDKQYFSDLYIPSYTPSLSALTESRKASPQTPEKPSLLLVAQPDDNLPGVRGEIKVIRQALKAQVTVTGLVSSEATPTSVLEGLRGSHFAHFACHGVLETGKPFEASFKLHGGSRLTLLDMVQSRLPDAEFAFLSCCHTAEITEESVADEVLHLTAAMQYCGFRSVVGTMWEMADTDGRDLANSFYKSLFSSREMGVRHYERSAGALRDATQKLRGKRGITLERWVNFVHYGA